MENNSPNHIPNVVKQALTWLDKMEIEYRFIPEAQLWEFIYDGLYLLLMNDCENNEFGIYAPMLITDDDDEEIQKMVYECSMPIIEMEFSSNCEVGYDGEGLCHISQWWGIQSPKPRLTKKIFMEKLGEMHELQLKFHFILHCTYEGMFNPPRKVMEEIFRNIKNEETDETEK